MSVWEAGGIRIRKFTDYISDTVKGIDREFLYKTFVKGRSSEILLYYLCYNLSDYIKTNSAYFYTSNKLLQFSFFR